MTVDKKTKDVSSQEKNINSRRSLLKKTAIGVPAVLTLTSKPALGAVCSLSGFQSVNPSGVARHNVGCGGISPGGWKENGYKTGNMDGSREMWLDAGCNPNPRVAGSLTYDTKKGEYPDDGPGTLFYSVFSGASPTVFVDASDTLHDVLLKNPGSLEFHTISNYLNASYFGWGFGAHAGKINAADVKGIYLAYTSAALTYTTVSGQTIDLNSFDLQYFFDQLYH